MAKFFSTTTTLHVNILKYRDPRKMILGIGLGSVGLLLKHFKFIDIGYGSQANKSEETK